MKLLLLHLLCARARVCVKNGPYRIVTVVRGRRGRKKCLETLVAREHGFAYGVTYAIRKIDVNSTGRRDVTRNETKNTYIHGTHAVRYSLYRKRFSGVKGREGRKKNVPLRNELRARSNLFPFSV